MMLGSNRFTILLALSFGITLACSPASLTQTEGATGAAQGVSLVVQPSTAAVAPGGAVQFAVTAYGTREGEVQWSIAESAGGSVDAQGRYTAPQASGTYHVVARSVADGQVTATATVTVSDEAPPAAGGAGGSPTPTPTPTPAPTPTPTPTPRPTPTPTPTPTPSPTPRSIAPATWTLSDWQTRFLQAWPVDSASSAFHDGSGSGDLYWMGYGIDAATTAYLAGLPGPSSQPSTYYIDWALGEAEHWMDIACAGCSPGTSSSYKGWPQTANTSPLAEFSGWRYVTKLLRVINQTPALLSAYASRYAAVLAFSEVHVFEKWRQVYGDTLKVFGADYPTPAMGAQIALDLWLCSTDPTRKQNEYSSWTSITTWLRGGVIAGGILYAAQGHGTEDVSDASGSLDLSHAGQFYGMLAEFVDQEKAGTISPQWTSYLDETLTSVKNVWWRPEYSSWSVYSDGQGGSIETSSATNGPISAINIGDAMAQLARWDSTIQHQLEIYVTRNQRGGGWWLPSNLLAHGAYNYRQLSGW